MDPQEKTSLHTGAAMPILGLGTWQLTNNTAETVEAALRIGYRLIDTSGDYGTQPGIGESIRRSGIPRDELYIVTKVEEDDDAYEATKKNVAELQLEYADLVLIHRPPPQIGTSSMPERVPQTNLPAQPDPPPPQAGEALWEGLIRAKLEGFTKDIGVSNYSEDLIRELMDTSMETPVVNQIEWSPFGYSQGMQRFCEERGIIIQAYSPLTRTKRLDDEVLVDLAAKYGKTPAQILIRWCLERGVVPIPKANQVAHLEENFDVFDIEIGVEDMVKLNGLNEHYSSLGSLSYV